MSVLAWPASAINWVKTTNRWTAAPEPLQLQWRRRLLLLSSSYLIQIHGSYSRCQGLSFSGLYKCYLAVKLVKKGKKTCCHCYYYFMCAFPLSLLPLSPMCLYMFTSLCVNLLCSSRRRVTNLLYKKNNKSTILSCGAYCNIYVRRKHQFLPVF